jgi:capsular exopolysaccharide synthesis family protein
MPEFTGQNDLRNYLRVVLRWKWLIIALIVAAPLVAYLMVRGKPNVYRSQTLMSVASESVNVSSASGLQSNFSTTNLEAVAQLATTTSVANIAGGLMKPPVPGPTIVGDVSVTPNETTDFLTVVATADSPGEAAAIANAFAKAISINQSNAAVSQLKQTIAQLGTEIAKLKTSDPARTTLIQQRNSLQGSLGNQNIATILQSATPNAAPIGPHRRRSVELGLLIGILLAFGAVLLLEGADRRLHTAEQLEAIADVPLLATIPASAFSDKLDTGVVDEEAFQMLRTSLTYFTNGDAPTSVLITSATEKEGKSTVSARLSLAAAKAGMNVIMLDADMRRGGGSLKFGLQPDKGLAAVLLGSLPLDEALVEWRLPEDHDSGRLRILPAGPAPANPWVLLGSEQVRHLLPRLEEMSDLVVIDSAAALAVSDAVPLMPIVSGIVVVARMDQSGSDTVRHLLKIIAAAHGKVLGLVATNLGRDGYYSYSKSYYSANGTKTGSRRGGKVGA